jgi:hypothetical protein
VDQLETEPVIPGHATKPGDVVVVAAGEVHVHVSASLDDGPASIRHVAVHGTWTGSLYRDGVHSVCPRPVVVVILAVCQIWN